MSFDSQPLIIACGALVSELRAVLGASGIDDSVEVKYLPANLHNRPDGSTKYNQEPDFKFIVFKKFLSVENELGIKDGFLLKSYFLLKKMGQSDERAFGLDKSDTEVESVPMLLSDCTPFQLTRNQ